MIAIWVYALLMIIPTMLGKYGSFGYSAHLGKCDYIQMDGVDARPLFFSVGFGLPAVIILFSYFLIWNSTTRSSSFLKLNSWVRFFSLSIPNQQESIISILETRKQIENRERKMTWTLFGMSFGYILFVAPIFLCNIFDAVGSLNLVCYMLYWCQV